MINRQPTKLFRVLKLLLACFIGLNFASGMTSSTPSQKNDVSNKMTTDPTSIQINLDLPPPSGDKTSKLLNFLSLAVAPPTEIQLELQRLKYQQDTNTPIDTTLQIAEVREDSHGEPDISMLSKEPNFFEKWLMENPEKKMRWYMIARFSATAAGSIYGSLTNNAPMPNSNNVIIAVEAAPDVAQKFHLSTWSILAGGVALGGISAKIMQMNKFFVNSRVFNPDNIGGQFTVCLLFNLFYASVLKAVTLGIHYPLQKFVFTDLKPITLDYLVHDFYELMPFLFIESFPVSAISLYTVETARQELKNAKTPADQKLAENKAAFRSFLANTFIASVNFALMGQGLSETMLLTNGALTVGGLLAYAKKKYFSNRSTNTGLKINSCQAIFQ